MKKKVVVLFSLLFISLFVGGITGEAAPSVRQSKVLNSGEGLSISVGNFRTEDFASKFVSQFRVESDSKESIIYEELVHHPHSPGWELKTRKFLYTNGTEKFYSNAIDEELLGTATGQRVFKVYNYSATPVTISFGVNSSIQPKAIPCVNYGDIDFEL